MFYNDMKYLNGVGGYQGTTYGVPVRAETFYGPNYQIGLAGIFDKLIATVKKTTAQVKKPRAVVGKSRTSYKRVIHPDGSVTLRPVLVRAKTFYGPNYQMGLAGIFDKLKETVKKTTAQVKKAQAVVAKGKAFYKRVTNPDGSVTMVSVPAGTPGAVAAAPATPAWKKYLIPGFAVAGLGFFLLKRKKK